MIDAVMLEIISDSLRLNFLMNWLRRGGLGGVLGELGQSRKNPVSASAMLTGKFLQIRKVFVTSSILAEEYPDTLQYKISR